jgi:hypothetical protein
MLSLVNINDRVRQLMLDEIEMDLKNGILYLSPRLSAIGRHDYPELLKEAASLHNDSWLSGQLGRAGRMNSTEQKAKPRGGTTTARVPVTAPDTLAEGEFNRFYARAVCRLALETGNEEVEVYRAKQVSQPRAISAQLIGTKIKANELLTDLRTHQGMDTALRLPPGPNSGLSIKLL